ncbi:putative 2-aminoethylphosphonate ABC transporter permease subunit [Thalassobaculum sp.]|uniref:putative 2-aminoethylphosphonate ABC transporter permease subunit n=1 Tax=Thalassobaculum sp. TaxID=2022740 RepID=UPI0032EE8F6A
MASLGLGARVARPKLDRDAWLIRIFLLAIGLYLVLALALPLYTMLSKSFTTYRFVPANYELQIDRGEGWTKPVTLAALIEAQPASDRPDLATSHDGRLSVVDLLPDFSFRSTTRYQFRSAVDGAVFLIGSERIADQDWHTFTSNEFRRVVVRPAASRGVENYWTYFSTPSLVQSIENSVKIAAISTVITVTLAFAFAYALSRTCMPFKGGFRLIAMIPILVPSLLPGIALIYLFGNQGLLKEALFGYSIYGPIGIVIGSVFFTFPHAFIIIATALAISDSRLHEAALSLKASAWRRFWTVTIPSARYGLISAGFVVFTLVITDFGLPKVIGGQYDVLAVDIYKQVIGQQNFEMGAVVSVVLLVPAVLAFAVDRIIQRRQVAALSARAVPFEPKPEQAADWTALGLCVAVAVFIVGILAICQFAALVKLWPYDLTPSLRQYDFDRTDGGGWDAYGNSIRLAVYTAVIGTGIVFLGAYLVEKTQGFRVGRTLFQFLAMMPMAIPGMVLGLAYIFFFNDPANPLNFLYGTMAILVLSTVTHFYTVAHLTAVTALKQMDQEFESVSASLKQPVWRLFSRVTVPVCLPAILDISIYLFVNAMTTVSAVVFLYSPTTKLASVAVLNMDDAGDVAPAAAMGMMIFYTNVAARLLHLAVTRGLLARTQAWRYR